MALVSASEIKVGIMVVLAVILLVALTISVGDFQNLFTESLTIHITTQKIAGLDIYAPVSYSGVPIGMVSDIRYNEELEMVIVDATIDRDSPVAIDSEVKFTSAGLLTPLYVDIHGGSKEKKIKELLLQGKKIDTPFGKQIITRDNIYIKAAPYYSIGDVFALTGQIEEALEKVEVNLDSLYPTLSQVGDFIDNVSKETTIILKEVEVLATGARPRIIEMLDHTNSLIQDASAEVIPTLKNIRDGSDKVPPLLTKAGEGVTNVIQKAGGLIDAVSPEVVQTAEALQQTILALNRRVETIENNLTTLLSDVDHVVVENQDEINRIIRYLEQTSANLTDLSDQLAKNPWRILWKTDERRKPLQVSPEWNPLQLENQ